MQFTEHKNGRIEHLVVSAEDRWRLHGEIKAMFTRADAEGLERMMRRDPSMFFEQLPHGIQVSAAGRSSWDADWQKYGCWLGRACGPEKAPVFAGLVQMALEAGAHPDDRKLFGGDVLLYQFKWRNDPGRLRLALKHGASPDMPPQFAGEQDRSVVRQVLVELKSSLVYADLEGRGDYVKGLIESANILLDAGARIIDLPLDSPGGRNHPFASGISLVSEVWYEATSPWVLAPLQALVHRLHAAGGALDIQCSYSMAPLVVFAVRNRNMPLALQLIEMGAATDDASICRPAGPNVEGVRSLSDEAQRWVGPEGRALVLAAIMRRRIVSSTEATASTADAVSRPRSRIVSRAL